MPGNLRAAPAFDHILEKGTTIEKRIVNATAMMEVACFDRLVADRAPEGWIAPFLVALERFEAEHPDVKLKAVPPGR